VNGNFTEVYIAQINTSNSPLNPAVRDWDKVVFGGDRQLAYFTAPAYIAQGTTQASITFSSSINTGTPPAITSPTVNQYTLYEYVPINPIAVNATGTGGKMYYFTNALPQGLSFDPLSRVITGTPTKLYQNYALTLYAKDSNGISSITISISVIVPHIVNPQNGASAYTALLKQYVEVNAAQRSINNEAYPDQTRDLGTLMSPGAPDTSKHPPCGC
jgi:hypothetical protein